MDRDFIKDSIQIHSIVSIEPFIHSLRSVYQSRVQDLQGTLHANRNSRTRACTFCMM